MLAWLSETDATDEMLRTDEMLTMDEIVDDVDKCEQWSGRGSELRQQLSVANCVDICC